MKIDIKTFLIIGLSIMLIFFFMFGKHVNDKNYKNEIENLNIINKALVHRNDSLNNANLRLSLKITNIEEKINETKKELVNSQLQIDKLKKNKNEISSYVNIMSANDISNSLSKYLSSKK